MPSSENLTDSPKANKINLKNFPVGKLNVRLNLLSEIRFL